MPKLISTTFTIYDESSNGILRSAPFGPPYHRDTPVFSSEAAALQYIRDHGLAQYEGRRVSYTVVAS